MSATLAELNGRVYLDLEAAAEFLQLDAIHSAVVQSHTLRVSQSRNSSINVLLGVTPSFTPSESPYDITGLIGKGIPAWIEAQDNGGAWAPMRVINLAQLSDYENLGIQAAAFSAEESSDTSDVATQYVHFSVLPLGAVRIRFDRDSIRIGMEEESLLPDSVAGLIVKEAQNSIIPRMKVAIDLRTRGDKGLASIAKQLKESLSELYAQNALEIRELLNLWKVWAFRDRSGTTSFIKLTPSAKYAYGDC